MPTAALKGMEALVKQGRDGPATLSNPEKELNHGWPRAAKPQPKMNWPQENAKIAKKKRHKLFSLSSLRSFAAKIFLEWRDVEGVRCDGCGWFVKKPGLAGEIGCGQPAAIKRRQNLSAPGGISARHGGGAEKRGFASWPSFITVREQLIGARCFTADA